jgi:hypothetical protein
MKKLFFVLLLFKILLTLECNEVNFVASAISEILKNVTEEFDFVIFAKNDQNMKDIANQVMKLTKVPHTLTIVKFKDKIDLSKSAVLLFDEMLMFYHFHIFYSTLINEYPRENLFFLSYIQENRYDLKLPAALAVLTKLNLFKHGNFLLHDKNRKSLRLTTFANFQQPNCSEWKEIEVYRFSKSSKKVQKVRDLFEEKFNNFNGCGMTVLARYPQMNYFNCFYDIRNIWHCNGSAAAINVEISKNLNYTFRYLPWSLLLGYEPFGYEYDFEIETFSDKRRSDSKYILEKVFGTERFTTVDEIILISRSAPYSSFHKIFLPFDSEVWHWLIATLVIAIAVICILRFLPRKIQSFVIGSNVQTPLLNLMFVEF